MATVSSKISKKITGYLVVGLVHFGEVSLSQKVCKTEDVVLYLFACCLILACVHFNLDHFIRSIENLNVLLYFV
jgi:hypothetical protein